MNVFHSCAGFFYQWIMAPLLAGIAVLSAMNLFWEEWLMLEVLVGYGIAFFNFVWTQFIFYQIRGYAFEVFVQQFFVWSGLKSVLVFVKACVVLSLTNLDPQRFIVCLVIAYFIFMFCGSYSIIKRSAAIES